MTEISANRIDELSQLRTGTAKNKRGLRTAARILKVATKIFIKNGYSNTSLRSVAKAARVDIYNVQYYFHNKENLLAAIFESHVNVFHEKLDQIVQDKDKTAEQRFASILDAQFNQNRGSEMRGLYTQHLTLAENSEFAANLLDKTFTNYRNIIAGLIKEMNPSITKRESLRRSSLISVFLEGYCIYLGHWIPKHSEHKGLEKEAHKRLMQIACD